MPALTQIWYPTSEVYDPTAGSIVDGNSTTAASGRQTDLLTSEAHGRYYSMTLRGRMFVARTAHAGAVIPVYSTNAPNFILYNPAGSGVNLEFVQLQINMLAATQVYDAFWFNFVRGSEGPNPISLLTNGGGSNTIVANGIQNCLLGSGHQPKSILLSSTHRTWNNQGDNTIIPVRGLMALAGSPNVFADFGGSIVVPQGTMVTLVAGDLGPQTSAAMISLTYAEVPV